MQKIWKFGIYLFILNKLDKLQSSDQANFFWDLVKKFLESGRPKFWRNLTKYLNASLGFVLKKKPPQKGGLKF